MYSFPYERRTRAQSKVAYYPPRSENHQKVAPTAAEKFWNQLHKKLILNNIKLIVFIYLKSTNCYLLHSASLLRPIETISISLALLTCLVHNWSYLQQKVIGLIDCITNYTLLNV